ncbi:MAG: hypothetical protein QXH60_01440, partial [Candidatus Pacearchaeota archaeon]
MIISPLDSCIKSICKRLIPRIICNNLIENDIYKPSFPLRKMKKRRISNINIVLGVVILLVVVFV